MGSLRTTSLPMICDLPGRHFSLRMSPWSALRHVRPGPGLGHRERVASRERFNERLVEVGILFGLILRLDLGFLGHGNSSGSPFHNQPEIAVSGQDYPWPRFMPISRKPAAMP